MESWKKRRRTYIVNKSLQYRFLVTILIYCVITILFILFYLFVPEFVKLNDESLSLEVRVAAADRVLMLHSRIWPAVITLIILLGIHSVLLFHRVAGPLYRFQLAFEQIKQGKISFRVKLRKKDYLHDQEEVFNDMMDILEGRLRDIKKASLDSLNSLNELDKKASGWTETDRELLRVHREHMIKLADAAEYF
jgi:methyl-accepting chemotaxis protein